MASDILIVLPIWDSFFSRWQVHEALIRHFVGDIMLFKKESGIYANKSQPLSDTIGPIILGCARVKLFTFLREIFVDMCLESTLHLSL